MQKTNRKLMSWHKKIATIHFYGNNTFEEIFGKRLFHASPISFMFTKEHTPSSTIF